MSFIINFNVVTFITAGRIVIAAVIITHHHGAALSCSGARASICHVFLALCVVCGSTADNGNKSKLYIFFFFFVFLLCCQSNDSVRDGSEAPRDVRRKKRTDDCRDTMMRWSVDSNFAIYFAFCVCTFTDGPNDDSELFKLCLASSDAAQATESDIADDFVDFWGIIYQLKKVLKVFFKL